MNSLAEALGVKGCQVPPPFPAPPYRERQQMAYETGRRIVDAVREDMKPSRHSSEESLPQRHSGEFRDRQFGQCAHST